MMRGLAFLTAICAATGAMAADMPMKAAPFAPPAVASWTGFYIGANVGGGFGRATIDGVGSDNISGVIGGAQLGYNWQIPGSPVVLGIEGDFQGSGQSRTDSAFGISVKQEIPWFATVRGRIGYAPGPWMIYATGGWADVDFKLTGSAGGLSASDSVNKSAWTIGGGWEWMFLPRWSVKAEYLFIDTGNTSASLFGIPFNGRLRDNIARAGVNYHF